MRKTSLIIMAAGLGSRFGQGIKQLTSFGPGGEIIMDYSVYDALEAGFDRIIFVIRKDLEKDFKEIIGDRISKKAEVAYVFQDANDIPEGFSYPDGRKKPWGTGHAVLAARKLIDEPFAVINADDYYGKEAFKVVHEYLVNLPEKKEDDTASLCMAGFILKNTLSDNGGVTRGVCSVNEDGILTGICETKGIEKCPQGAQAPMSDGSMKQLDPQALVSMNFWGYEPEMMGVLEKGFRTFLEDLTSENETTAEYLLPIIVDGMIKNQTAKVTVCPTNDSWFGVTYQSDVPTVKDAIANLIKEGEYPERLWD